VVLITAFGSSTVTTKGCLGVLSFDGTNRTVAKEGPEPFLAHLVPNPHPLGAKSAPLLFLFFNSSSWLITQFITTLEHGGGVESVPRCRTVSDQRKHKEHYANQH
jgi:hypothetical protein